MAVIRCGEPVESVTHIIFDCPPVLQVWALSPTSPNIFPSRIPMRIWIISYEGRTSLLGES